MCRWVAYAGPDIFLEDLIFHQENSIIHQSLSAKHSEWVTNGDGFGVAWYGKRTAPGLFKDILPAGMTATFARLPLKFSPGYFSRMCGPPRGLL